MKFGLWGLVLLSFTIGLFTAHLLNQPQIPAATIAAERASPQDWISEDQISVFNDKVVLDIPGAYWATFTDTNSMDPLLDQGANAIQVIPQSPEQLQVGDVITYNYKGRKIIHRIVQTGQDAEGYYYIVKGDNNPEPDPVRVRFTDIDRVLVAIVY